MSVLSTAFWIKSPLFRKQLEIWGHVSHTQVWIQTCLNWDVDHISVIKSVIALIKLSRSGQTMKDSFPNKTKDQIEFVAIHWNQKIHYLELF